MARNSLGRALVAHIMVLAVSLSYSGIEFFPHYGYPSPVYFSGTNARAFYRAQITAPHNHIAKFELYLNDLPTLVLNTPVVPGGGGGGEPGQGTGLIPVQEGAVMFDSFYYSFPLEAVTVKCRVLAETHPGGTQQWFEHTYTAPAKNKAAIFSMNEWEVQSGPYWPDSVGGYATKMQLQEILYPNTTTWKVGWNDNDFRNELLNGTNVLFYHGHSTSLRIRDGTPHNEETGKIWLPKFEYNPGQPPFPRSPSIEQMREDAIAYPWPPFNASGHPALNIAFFISCETIQDVNQFTYTLYPYYNGYGKYLENQAFLGWRIKPKEWHAEAMATVFWMEMRSGKDIESARRAMMDSPIALLNYNGSDTDVVGDDFTKLRRVYNPSPAPTLLWWRPIPMP